MNRPLTKASTLALMLAAFALPGCNAGECTGEPAAATPDQTAPSDSANNSASSQNAGFSGAGAASAGAATSSSAAQRAIAEADIIQEQDGKLYAMSKSGTVSIVDVSVPGQASRCSGRRRSSDSRSRCTSAADVIIAMTDGAFDASGKPIPAGTDTLQLHVVVVVRVFATSSTTSTDPDPTLGAGILTLDMSDPANIKTTALLPVPGPIADSRIVGNVLYLATYENAACFGCGDEAAHDGDDASTSTDPADARRSTRCRSRATRPTATTCRGASAWKRSIIATTSASTSAATPTSIRADFGDAAATQGRHHRRARHHRPDGQARARRARSPSRARCLSRWQMDETNGVLRVISQRGAGRTGNGIAMPEVATFTIADTQTFDAARRDDAQLPRQEGLRTVRFDTDRAYAITYNQTDPLFTIDLAIPAKPVQRGQLSMPGFMFYLEPHGDRVIGLGVDRTDPNGSLNVSLFDVSNLDDPTMLKRVAVRRRTISARTTRS